METANNRPSPMAKWVSIMEAFLETEEWGVRELARRVALPRSAVHRTLHEMERLSLLKPGSDPGRFRPGPGLYRIATILSVRMDLKRLARPILEETVTACQETVVLTMYDPQRRQFYAVDAIESQQAVRYIWDALREWTPVHAGSSGKGILAFLPLQEQEDVLAQLPDPVPGLRALAKAELREQLARARQTGYVVSRSERHEGAMGAAAPVRDAVGRVVGDLIITAPEIRMSRRPDAEWGEMVRRAANQISTALGMVGEGHVSFQAYVPATGGKL